MPKITALLHCHGSADKLARCLESLRACDETLVINHNADPKTESTIRQYGATVKTGVPGVSPGTYLVDATNDWLFCLKESETLSEDLEASLLEWKQQEHEPSQTFAVKLRSQVNGDWKSGERETRLVNRTCVNWISDLPPNDENSEILEGDLLDIEQHTDAA